MNTLTARLQLDSPALRHRLAQLLPPLGFRVQAACHDAPGRDASPPHVVFLHPSQGAGLVAAEVGRLRAVWPEVPLLALVEASEVGVAALRAGAFACLRLPLDPSLLRRSLQRALMSRGVRLERAAPELAAAGEGAAALSLGHAARLRISLRDLEDRYIDQVLALTGGNKVQAARILGIDRKTLYRRAERRSRAGRDAGAANSASPVAMHV